jgi:CHAD domain-containing protein
VATNAAEEHRERELKFDVALDWELPDPAGLTTPEGSVERETVHLETTYFDTDACDLLRNRLTLRRRTGDADVGWQLKVPDGDARTEIRLPLAGHAMPAELREATLGARGGAALKRLASLVTERELHRLLDDEGTPLAEIVVDTVTASHIRDAAGTRHWREVEVELVQGDEQLLDQAARWLAKRGAEPSSSRSKLARAVEAATVERRGLSTLAGLVGSYLDRQIEAMVRGDVTQRRGGDAIHDTRVATRRYRSVLRVLGALFDPERAAALDAELAWYSSGLGAVRDSHVLRTHLDRELADLPPGLIIGPVAARIDATLAHDEHDASVRLAAQMRTKRYFALLAELSAWREQVPVVADEPAANIADYLDKAQRKVRLRIAAAPKGAGRDEALHRARKAAKRARYIAELSRPELGDQGDSVRKAMKKTQERLGVRQDRVVAAEFLRRVGAAAIAAGENGFTYGLLYERERSRAHKESG